MRAWEIVLLVMNIMALSAVAYPRKSAAVLWTFAGVNAAVFAAHALIEGMRYQMIAAYGFVFLFAIYAIARPSMRQEPKKWFVRLLKGTAIGATLLALAVSALFSQALPVFALPKPTGDYPVGVVYAYLKDDKRTEPFLKDSTSKRELAVKIYYPADEERSKAYVSYFHGSPALLRAFTAGYHLPDLLFSHLRLVQTHAREEVEVSARQRKYPVLLFSHGGGTTMEAHAAQCEDLASQGYVVAAINHTYVSSATELPGRIVTDRDATTEFDQGDPLAIITQIMADDDGFVLDTLTGWNAGQSDSPFAGKLDLERVGVVGHSLGGAAAYNLALNDSRIKAAVNLDGGVYAVPDDAKRMAPYLMLANDEFHVEAIRKREVLMRKWEDMPAEEQEAISSAYGSKEAYLNIYEAEEKAVVEHAEMLQDSGNLYTITGSAHMKFSDIGLFPGAGFHRFLGINGDTSAARCLEIAMAATLAFFNNHLREGEEGSVGELQEKYPELRKVELT